MGRSPATKRPGAIQPRGRAPGGVPGVPPVPVTNRRAQNGGLAVPDKYPSVFALPGVLVLRCTQQESRTNPCVEPEVDGEGRDAPDRIQEPFRLRATQFNVSGLIGFQVDSNAVTRGFKNLTEWP